MQVTVLGAGSWGTTIASLLATRHTTLLWARSDETAAEIDGKHTNEAYLSGFQLPQQLLATADLEKAVRHAELLIVGVPSAAMRTTIRDAREWIHPWIPIVSLAKGLEQKSLLRMTEVIAEEAPGHPIAALTGPNIAREIMSGQAAASVIATEDLAVASAIQRVLTRGVFRVYTNHDVIGCELSGALKNVVAIACGIAQGLGVGDNTRAAVMTRGLAELTRLGVAMGGEAVTFAGLAGMGDLVTTCISPHSRNRYVGEQLGLGRKLEDITAEMTMVAEGVKTAVTARELSERHGVPMPVFDEIYKVVSGRVSADKAYQGLRVRPGHEADPGVTAEPALDVLERIQQRVLWLAVRIVDSANRERPPGEIKVGGHQASSASMVGIMTALWFGHLTGEDKVAVKPHASPVYHAIKYLTGELDRSYLTRLRALGGLQSYPSRTKDPDVADFSTGSVGLGVVAPLFAAAARRYVEAHFGPRTDSRARFIAIGGDAELDEGNVWEAVADPALQGLGNVMWVVDTNRQSLDRVVPDQKIKKLMELFGGAGWHVVEAKYGNRLTEAFARPGGDALRRYIDEMSNEEYQSLFAHQGSDLREKFLAGADESLRGFLAEYPDDEIAPLVQNLGGHDLRLLIDCYRACDAVPDRPSVVFAYTVKGWGLPIAGDPLNHSVLLSADQIGELRASVGLTAEEEWERFDPASPEGAICGTTGAELNNVPPPPRRVIAVPGAMGVPAARPVSTQETFGRLLTRLADVEGVGERIVTTSPDVSVSTNLGGWINKMGVFAPEDRPDFLGEDRLLRWQQAPAGQHIELGISEMNLFLLLHGFGLAHELHGEHLLPIGTVYDPFVCRGLDALIYALYSGARFVVVGTPAGITLAPEGGAHQSTITPSIGLELPGLTYAEPAYAGALDWLLCDGLARLGDAGGTSLYLRLSTRPIDQAPFAAAAARLGNERLRADVLAGGYRLAEPVEPAAVVLATCGPVVPEVLAAAELLAVEGMPALVLDLTSPDRLYRQWRYGLRDAARQARTAGADHHLGRLLVGPERSLPIVTVHDAASHHLAWLGGVFGVPVVPVGVDEFGQSGSIPELYGLFDLLPEQIVNAALLAAAG